MPRKISAKEYVGKKCVCGGKITAERDTYTTFVACGRCGKPYGTYPTPKNWRNR